jgi:hypothetical protein
MTSRTALLDTSAFKGLSRDALSAAQEAGWQLKTSPWCFFELLCHLDEESDFPKAKGNLMKFRGIEIIDKPLDRAVAKLGNSEEPRVWSSGLCYAALAAIDAAQSYDDLANSVLLDEAGNTRGPLKDVALQVRRVLDEAEHEFQDHMTSMIATLKAEGQSPRSPEQNHQVIMDTVLRAEGLPLPDTPDLDYSIIDPEIAIKDSYCFWGYSLFQAIWLERIRAVTCDKNDLEDGQLCAYVPLNEELWVVAGDKKLRSRLEDTRNLLKGVGLSTRAQFHPITPDALSQRGPS